MASGGLTVHLIPHTHWDREWYLTEARFSTRLAEALDRLFVLLDREPALRFHLDGQAALIEDYLRYRPEAIDRVRAAVSAGRLTVGPWHILADELIPSGESLIRNLLLGRRVAAGVGGVGRVFYSPDAFGHPATAPLLAAEFDLVAAVVWRGLDPKATGGRDLARWTYRESALTVLHLPADGYEFGIELVAGLGDAELAARWTAIRAVLVTRALTDQVAVLIGADHHAPSDRLVGLPERLAMIDPANNFRFSSFDEYFAAARPGAARNVSGELRRAGGHTWALQGVHGTRCRLKRLHGVAALELARIAEPAAALARLDPGSLAIAWKRLVESQFHDTLAGTCIDPVAREQAVRLNAARAIAKEQFHRAIDRLAGHDPDEGRRRPGDTRPALAIWNPVARQRGGVVVVETSWFRSDVLVGPPGARRPRVGPGAVPFSLRVNGGAPRPVQVLATREGLERIDAPSHYPDLDRVDRVFVAVELPAVGGLSLQPVTVDTESAGRPVAAKARTGRRKTMVAEETVFGPLGMGSVAASNSLPASSGQTTPRAPDLPRAGVEARGRTVTNDLVGVEVGADGCLTLDDRVRRERYRGLGRLEATADRGDCYTPETGGVVGRFRVDRHEVLAAGPLVGAVAAWWTIAGGAIAGRTVVTLHAGDPIVRIRIDLDNWAKGLRLRWTGPTGVAGDALAGAGHGVVRRPPGAADRTWSSETALPTDPAHRFVAVASGNRGIALLHPAFFEYQWTPTGHLAWTMFRSVGELSRDGLAARRGHAAWPAATPGAEEPGRHVVEVALVPIDDAMVANPARVVTAWEDAFLPPIARWLRGSLGIHSTAGPELEGEGVVLEAIKPAEDGDGLIFRVGSVAAAPVEARWHWPGMIAAAERVRADETTVTALAADGDSVRFQAEPGELVSIRIRPPFEAVG